jgi:hypothetical protein
LVKVKKKRGKIKMFDGLDLFAVLDSSVRGVPLSAKNLVNFFRTAGNALRDA